MRDTMQVRCRAVTYLARSSYTPITEKGEIQWLRHETGKFATEKGVENIERVHQRQEVEMWTYLFLDVWR